MLYIIIQFLYIVKYLFNEFQIDQSLREFSHDQFTDWPDDKKIRSEYQFRVIRVFRIDACKRMASGQDGSTGFGMCAAVTRKKTQTDRVLQCG